MDLPSTPSTSSSKAGALQPIAKPIASKVAPKSTAPKSTPAAPAKPKAASAKAPRPRVAKVTVDSAAIATSSPDVPSEEQAVAKPDPDALNDMIATAAYYMAVQRNFEPGGEVGDWLEAERQIRAFYG